jgi:hypothetical protein
MPLVTLTGESFLLDLGILGLSFAGFCGIILAMRSGKWEIKETTAFKFILEHSFGMALLSLLPSLLFYSGLWDEKEIWRISNGALASFLSLLWLTHLFRLLGVGRTAVRPTFPGMLWGMYIAPSAILIAVEFRETCIGSMVWFSIGLVYLLIQAAIQFWLRLIVYTKPQV